MKKVSKFRGNTETNFKSKLVRGVIIKLKTR